MSPSKQTSTIGNTNNNNNNDDDNNNNNNNNNIGKGRNNNNSKPNWRDNESSNSRKQRKAFDKKHIQGDHKPRPINDKVDFNDSKVRYKSVKESGTGSGSRVTGHNPDEKKVVTSKLEYTGTGKKNRGHKGESHFLITAGKEGKKVSPRHLDGKVEMVGDKRYKDSKGREYQEASSSTSAAYTGSEDHSSEEIKITSCKPNKSNKPNKKDGGGGGGSSSTGYKTQNSSSRNGVKGMTENKTKDKKTTKETENSQDNNKKTTQKNNSSFKREIARQTIASVGNIGLDIVDTAFIRNGKGYQDVKSSEKSAAIAETHVDEVGGLRIFGANASATTESTHSGVTKSPVKATAFAGASVAQAQAKAYVIEGLEASAAASLCDANASASAGVDGFYAGAGARYARAAIGIKNTPLQAHVELAGANAETGISWSYAGASAGAHLGEAGAGPFAVRAGFKFGGGVRNGVPEIDLGPTTAPCCIM